jgi:hypothetical protein
MVHEIECGPDRFWELFLDKEFATKMFQHLGFPKWELVEQKETDTQIIRVIKAVPKLEVPGPVAKALGSGFGYTEHGTFDKATKKYTFVIKPSTLEGKLKNEGTVRTEPLDGGKRTKRIVDVVAEAKVFGIGGMLESATEKGTKEGWAAGARYMNDWLKKNS